MAADSSWRGYEGDDVDGDEEIYENQPESVLDVEQRDMQEIDAGLDRILHQTDIIHHTGEKTAAQLVRQGETMRRAIDDLDDQNVYLSLRGNSSPGPHL